MNGLIGAADGSSPGRSVAFSSRHSDSLSYSAISGASTSSAGSRAKSQTRQKSAP